MRIIIACPESDSPLKGRIHLRGLSFNQLQTSCSSAADHTLSAIEMLQQLFSSATEPNVLITTKRVSVALVTALLARISPALIPLRAALSLVFGALLFTASSGFRIESPCSHDLQLQFLYLRPRG